jgi:hypothetical protein
MFTAEIFGFACKLCGPEGTQLIRKTKASPPTISAVFLCVFSCVFCVPSDIEQIRSFHIAFSPPGGAYSNFCVLEG